MLKAVVLKQVLNKKTYEEKSYLELGMAYEHLITDSNKWL